MTPLAQSLVWRHGWICRYCYEPVVPELGPSQAQVEHIEPFSRGGSWDDENLVVACRTCNLRKRDRTPEEWFNDLVKCDEEIPRGLPSFLVELQGENNGALFNPYGFVPRTSSPELELLGSTFMVSR